MAFGRSNQTIPGQPLGQPKSPEQQKSQEVAKAGNAPPPAFLDKMKQDAGKGVSTAAEDRIVPLIYILQANSPQAKSRDPKYIEGARDGDIWMRNSAEREVIPGDEGFEFQPCYFYKVWLEWLPDRGGFVAQHADDGRVDPSTKRAIPPAMLRAVEKEIEGDGGIRKVWMTPAGTILVHTRQHVGLANGRPYVVPMSSSGHTVSRKWMDQMNQFMIPGTKDLAPSFARKWLFRTVNTTNAKNQSWSIWKIEDAGWVTAEEYEIGAALHEAFARGAMSAAAPDADHASDDSGTSGTAGAKDQI